MTKDYKLPHIFHGSMTLYIQHNHQELTIYQKNPTEWVARLARQKHHKEALIIRTGDLLNVKSKCGTPKFIIKVSCFKPHLKYGTFTRCGTIIPQWVVDC